MDDDEDDWSRTTNHRNDRISRVLTKLRFMFMLVIAASGIDRLDVLVSLLFVGNGFLGLVIPATSVLAMEDYGEFAGTASALMGTLQFATGAICMIVAGLFFNGRPLPMIAGIAICAVTTFIIAQVTLSRSRDLPAAPAD